jgi:hypothetical protein
VKKIIVIFVLLLILPGLLFAEEDEEDKKDKKGFHVDLGFLFLTTFPPKEYRESAQATEDIFGTGGISEMANFAWMLNESAVGPVFDLEFYFFKFLAIGGEVGVLICPFKFVSLAGGFAFQVPLLANIRLDIFFFFLQPEFGLLLDGYFKEGEGTFVPYLVANGKAGFIIGRARIFVSLGVRFTNLERVHDVLQDSKAILQVGLGMLFALTK